MLASNKAVWSRGRDTWKSLGEGRALARTIKPYDRTGGADELWSRRGAAAAETLPSSTGGDTPTSLVSTVPTLGQSLPVGSAICNEIHTQGLNLINANLPRDVLHFHVNKVKDKDDH